MSEETEPVGSVAEEAIKLLGALQGWAKENAHDPSTAAAGASSRFGTVNEHIARGGQECSCCPLCQLISGLREVSPEVMHHLKAAALSVLRAATESLAGQITEPPARRSGPIEHIDLSGEEWDSD